MRRVLKAIAEKKTNYGDIMTLVNSEIVSNLSKIAKRWVRINLKNQKSKIE